MTDVSLAALSDLPGLVALEASFPSGQRWSEESWREELTADNRHVLKCTDEGVIGAAATFAISDDVVDLHRIVTAQALRRQGLAGRLMDSGIEWARTQGANRVLLEVEDTNASALALYGAQGFTTISERRDYYGPGAHALILQRRIAEGESS